MRLAISAAGIASAQGGLTQSFNSTGLRKPESWPWPVSGWTTSHVCRSAVGVNSDSGGIARWKDLVQLALADCFGNELPDGDTPIFIGSCNGATDGIDSSNWRKSFDSIQLLETTPWAGKRFPIFSSSCNSGLHALFAATKALEAGAKEAVVLGVDILSQINQSNFESLRVLAEYPAAPWQQDSSGFILGEAAVALKITASSKSGAVAKLTGPVLTNSLGETDGLMRVLDSLPSFSAAILLGQGTGPNTRDQSELAAFRNKIEDSVHVSTPLLHFGHTLGASGLLSIALAFKAQSESRVPKTLAMSMPMLTSMSSKAACDGRPLVVGSERLDTSDCILVTSGAMDGSCAGAFIGSAREDFQTQGKQGTEEVWQQPQPAGPLTHQTLRQIAADAIAHRPERPPDLLLVRLLEPLAPPASAWFGKRLLPSAVLEITPGFVSQLIARCWGFTGPALCMVGETETVAKRWELVPACEALRLSVVRIDVKGTGDNREIIWKA